MNEVCRLSLETLPPRQDLIFPVNAIIRLMLGNAPQGAARVLGEIAKWAGGT
jgi:hypothetical protein